MANNPYPYLVLVNSRTGWEVRRFQCLTFEDCLSVFLTYASVGRRTDPGTEPTFCQIFGPNTEPVRLNLEAAIDRMVEDAKEQGIDFLMSAEWVRKAYALD